MTTQQLDEYEDEYRGHVQAAEEKLALAESGPASEDGGAAVAAAERATEAAKDVYQLMELEGRQLSGAAKTRLQTKLRSARDELAALRARLKKCRAMRTPDRIREECYSRSEWSQGGSGERERMLANNERIGKGNDRLKDAHAVTLDMENTANSILGDLSRQRETIMHARGTLSFASERLDASRRVLGQMARRAAMNKLTLYVVIALLIGMLLLLMWPSASGGGSVASGSNADGSATTAGTDWKRRP